MPDAKGRIKGVSIPRVPWHEKPPRTKPPRRKLTDDEIARSTRQAMRLAGALPKDRS